MGPARTRAGGMEPLARYHRDAMLEAGDDPAARGRPGADRARQACCACGATSELGETDPYARRGDARFCPDCWDCLSPGEIERVVREVDLRGVPWS